MVLFLLDQFSRKLQRRPNLIDTEFVFAVNILKARREQNRENPGFDSRALLTTLGEFVLEMQN